MRRVQAQLERALMCCAMPPGKKDGGGVDTKLIRLNDFLFTAHMDNINLFKVRQCMLLHSPLEHLLQILRYCEKSQISRKVSGNGNKMKGGAGYVLALQLNGFVDRYFDTCCGVEPHSDHTPGSTPVEKSADGRGDQGSAAGEGNSRQMNSPLMLIESFLQALTNMDSDGRIVVTRSGRPAKDRCSL